jgi:hypothetical protein
LAAAFAGFLAAAFAGFLAAFEGPLFAGPFGRRGSIAVDIGDGGLGVKSPK